MGAGASTPIQTPKNSPKNSIIETGSGSPTKRGSLMCVQDDIDPLQYIADDQTLVHVGLVWKLNAGATRENTSDWRRRKMWITSGGSMFYYSQQNEKPLGRSIRGLHIQAVEGMHMEHYLFEVRPMAIGTMTDQAIMIPTVFACESLEQRDDWMRYLTEIQDMYVHKGIEENFALAKTSRRRSSMTQKSITILDIEGVNVDCHGLPERDKGIGIERDAVRVAPSVLNMWKAEQRSETAKSLSGDPRSEPKLLRSNSQTEFDTKANTFLVLDWDDTIFPTTFIRGDLLLDWKKPVADQVRPGPELDEIQGLLASLAEKIEVFLRLATDLAQVRFVTLARRPWVETSWRNFMPQLEKLLEELDIPVIYARDHITHEMEKEYHAAEFRSNEAELKFWMKAKANAMEEQLTAYHNEHGNSWKNIMSIGDSEIESQAMKHTGWKHMEQQDGERDDGDDSLTIEVSKDGHSRKLRTKVVKMVEDPGVEELTGQIALLTKWLPHLIKNERGLDIEIEDTADNTKLNSMHTLVTGKADELTWFQLAGIDQ